MKIYVLLLICLTTLACQKPDIELNLDNKELPALIAENLQGDSDCNISSTISDCPDGFALIDLCIECTACLTDDRLIGHRTVEIFMESLPRRDAQKITTVTSGPNYDFQETICVPIISGQESQIISFSLKESTTGFPDFSNIHNFIIYDNAILAENGTTKYHKDIVAEDLWDNALSCDIQDFKIAWEKEPVATEEFTIDYSYCIVGSIGECNTVSIPRTDFDLEIEIEEIKEFFQNQIRFNSIPCSGIYVSF